MTETPRSHAMSALVAKRAELMARVEEARRSFEGLMRMLDSLDETIALFDPAFDVGSIRPKRLLPPRVIGDVGQLLLDTLREAPAPMTTEALADLVIATRGLNASDGRMVSLAKSRTYACLRRYRSRGLLNMVAGADGAVLWEIAK